MRVCIIFAHVSFIVSKPCYKPFPQQLETIGDHIRQKRLEKGQSQPQVAKTIGVAPDTICLWETNQNTPQDQYMPSIISFLEYNPCITKPKTLGEHLKLWRLENGISIKCMIGIIKMDRQTIMRIENDDSRVTPKTSLRVISFLKEVKDKGNHYSSHKYDFSF